jgi:hypothetical protein
VAKLKSQCLEGGKIGLTPASKKLPTKFKMLKLGLKVIFENEKPHNICTQIIIFG